MTYCVLSTAEESILVKYTTTNVISILSVPILVDV